MVFPRVDSALLEYGIAVVRRYDRWNEKLFFPDSSGHEFHHRIDFDIVRRTLAKLPSTPLSWWLNVCERCARYELPHPRSLKIFGTLLSLKSRKSLQSRAYRSHDVFSKILLIWSWFRSLLQKRNAVSHFGRSMWNQVSSSWSDHN